MEINNALTNETLTTILSAFAVSISLITFYSQREYNKHSLRAVCKIDIYSIKGSFRIIFRNVGNGVMKVNNISYRDKNINKTMEILSNWLKDIPCETNCEENLNNTWVGATMSYNLLSRTMIAQADLDQIWDRLKNLRIEVRYEDTFGNRETYMYDLATDYKIYLAAKGTRDII